ncbi:MAG: signal peptidase I [Candidatus Saccharimonadales bacterium]
MSKKSPQIPPEPGVRADRHSAWRVSLSTIGILVAAPLIALALTAFVVQSYQVEGSSMEKTLNDKDRLIVNKLPRTWANITGHTYIPNRGDIIVFNQTGLPGYSGPKQLIKRVVGLPGERVMVQNGSVTIYNNDSPGGFDPDKLGAYQIISHSTTSNVDVQLSKDQVFVLGDNRRNSEDSRYFGPLKAESIVGDLMLRILPIDKAQKF